jgi:hypothetical protein
MQMEVEVEVRLLKWVCWGARGCRWFEVCPGKCDILVLVFLSVSGVGMNER